MVLGVLCACSQETEQGPATTASPQEPTATIVTAKPAAPVLNPTAGPKEGTRPVTGSADFAPGLNLGEAELGIPIYDGARPVAGGTWSLSDSLAEGADSLSSVRLHSSDPIEKIAAFYRLEMAVKPDQSFEVDGPSGKIISLTTESRMYASANVILKQQTDGTGIEINVMGRRASDDAN